MRIRTVLATAAGAAAGAAATYLLDPEHGRRRRRDVTGRAVRRGRESLDQAGRDLGQRTAERTRWYAHQARAGFAQSMGQQERQGR